VFFSALRKKTPNSLNKLQGSQVTFGFLLFHGLPVGLLILFFTVLEKPCFPMRFSFGSPSFVFLKVFSFEKGSVRTLLKLRRLENLSPLFRHLPLFFRSELLNVPLVSEQ